MKSKHLNYSRPTSDPDNFEQFLTKMIKDIDVKERKEVAKEKWSKYHIDKG